MASPVSSVPVFLLVVVVALLQESTLAQRGQVYSPDGPFNGVYYSHSRVAFTPRKNRTQNLAGDRRGYPGYIPTAATTRQTVVAPGYRPSSPPSYLESGQVAPSYPETRRVVPSYPETRRVVPSSLPSYPETRRVAPYSPSSYPEARRLEQSLVPSYPEISQVASTPPPSRLESSKVTTERVVYTPAHHVKSSQVAKKRKSQNRYGSSGVRTQEVRARPRGFASTSEYRGIQEGSYYDRSNTTAPANAIGPVFDWGTTGRRHHRHRHHHETTTAVSPQHHAPERYSEFGSRMRTYSPPRHHPTVAPRQTPLPTAAAATTTISPYLSRAVTTTRRYRRRPATDGGAAYHRRQRKRPAATMRRTSDSVSYVAGSYFPTSGGARKPSSGFAVQHRGAYDPDPITPSPRPPVYSPDRRQPLRDVRNDADYSHNNHVHDSQHPFASLAGSNKTCDLGSCYPATGNLLIGRENKLTATSTCGLHRKERYCIVSHLQDRKKCFFCDSTQRSRPRNSHRIENIVSRPGRRKEFWWQSENGVEDVSIRLDLEAEFHFTHLIITFKTFRPAAMLIERSYDFGRTWKVYKYFAYDCAEAFPGVQTGPISRITDVVCESRYSSVAPSTEGEVIFRVLSPNIVITDPYSEEVQNLLKMTNLRINFTKLHTLGDDLVDSREEIKQKYYYAIYDMVVRGSCSCYGHASHCVEQLPGISLRPDMVHGRCECTHNTKGLNCEECEDFYNDLPWRPAFGHSANACKRCNCNDHTVKCHFDPAVYEATGRLSGGVCDDCQHNTMGRNCELCRPFFYQDPGRRQNDPNVCQPCDCDPQGSMDDGICDPVTDSKNNLEAGLCHCKKNVDGRRCDRCKNGFWNFQKNNPDGCEACTCDPKGTIENQGCSQYTGECTCKRYVIGRDCNQCMAEHWGLSEERDGCKACDCDPGGALDNNCDVLTGQCRCRPHVTGRRCDRPEQGYFSGYVDYLMYEAEYAYGSPTAQVEIREPYGDREVSWTGIGFMRVYETNFLEFEVDNIQTSMEYDLVIRYEPQLPGRWEDVRVMVERPGAVDPFGPCANHNPSDDVLRTYLHSSNRHAVVKPPICLETNKPYKIRLEFRSYNPLVSTPSASLLIDSIALLPRIDQIPFFSGGSINEYWRQEVERFRCMQAFETLPKPSLSEICKPHLISIGFYTFGTGIECSCDLTGSVSSICDQLGGQCQCKTNVVGRRCDRCAPGTYGFSPSGCVPCDCNSVGALDNFCNATTGKCNCRANTYGRQCDECRPGYWNYPNCRPCECNGHADRCDPRTGYCIDCRDYTSGAHCDVCEPGYYGDPRSGHNIACRPCPCPGIPGEGHNFGATCALDSRTQNVICNCEEGYAGERCDRCANNYYGNPEVPGGQCQPCQCNNNIDIVRPGNCDGKTGECKNCLFNTEGFYCERCKPGHWGDAINQNCIECTCDLLGTDIAVNSGYCDPQTGQCPCLPNVMGMNCDRCLPNHWKLASGAGCEPCACDPVGSYHEQCNEFDGQCNCKPEFGGRKCDQCKAMFWGDPKVRCFPCECDRSGSETLQCHRGNGTCICRLGIGGEKCDRCARGYTGQAPYCSPCGECFDNWDFIIGQLREETLRLAEQAKTIKRTGVTGVYTEQFEEMEAMLEQVRQILAQANVTNVDIEDLQGLVDELRQNLTRNGDRVRDLDEEVDNTTQRIYDANQQLASLQTGAQKLQELAKTLQTNATAVQEENVEGALNITINAWRRSRAAQSKVEDAENTLRESERERKRTESLIDRAQEDFNRTFSENENALDEAAALIAAMEAQIPDINQDVCDGRGDPCSALCGGAGCGKCGGLSCNKGAVTKADEALRLARNADTLLKEKDGNASVLLGEISKAKQEADEAREEAQKAYDLALEAKNRSGEVRDNVNDLLDRITGFLEDESAKPQEIRARAEATLAMDIKLRPDEITDMAKQINDTIASLTDIDDILAATAEDVARAEDLKRRADAARDDAEDVFNTAKKVASALEDATEAQKKAREAIDNANNDIEAAENDLAQIASETAVAQDVANKSVDDVKNLKDKLNELRAKLLENERAIQTAVDEARGADRLAEKAQRQADDLERKYNRATKDLDTKVKESGDAKDKAKELQERADALAQNATDKLAELKEMEDEFMQHEILLRDLTKELEELDRTMMDYYAKINKKARHYLSCNP